MTSKTDVENILNQPIIGQKVGTKRNFNDLEYEDICSEEELPSKLQKSFVNGNTGFINVTQINMLVGNNASKLVKDAPTLFGS